MRTSPRFKPALALLATLLALVATPSRASADGLPAGNDVQVAQTLGPRELTVVIRRVAATPGPIRIEVVTHTGSPAGTLDLALTPTPTGEDPDGLRPAGTVTSRGRLVLGATPGLYGHTLAVDRPGPWEVAVGDGERTARIPFVVAAKVIPAWETATYGGFAAAGLFLVIALALAIRTSGRWAPLIPAGGMIAALAVAVTSALVSALIPPPPPPGSRLDPTIGTVTDPYGGTASSPTVDYSRPPVNLVATAPGSAADKPTEIRLALSDGSTGRPVDDLLIHHDALVHLMIVSPSGRLWHLHPIRVAPGDYRAEFTPTEGGTYAVAAELSRRGGGLQLARSPKGLPVAGAPVAVSRPSAAGRRIVGGTPVDLTTTTVGAATTIAARVGARADLQPWLGMVGHLIIVGPLPRTGPVGVAAGTAATWAHAHAMAPVSNALDSPPDETVAMFGPDVRFTYTFATPGRYRFWLQVERGFSVLTIPGVVDVPAGQGVRP